MPVALVCDDLTSARNPWDAPLGGCRHAGTRRPHQRDRAVSPLASRLTRTPRQETMLAARAPLGEATDQNQNTNNSLLTVYA